MTVLSQVPAITIAVLAHNEADRIEKCLASLPLGQPSISLHVIVNGSTDDTAELSRRVAKNFENVTVHDWQKGGKSRSWNRFVFEELSDFSATHIFVDGDAEVKAGSVIEMDRALHTFPHINAVAGMPLNGRSAQHYRKKMLDEHGLFGDLYALSGDFLKRMKSRNVRLPQDLVGEDGLLAALAKTALDNEGFWSNDRVFICENAGFWCEPFRVFDLTSWINQYRRMISYSKRNFQNQIIKDIMLTAGPSALPPELAPYYQLYGDRFQIRGGITGFFDRLALKRMMNEHDGEPASIPPNGQILKASL